MQALRNRWALAQSAFTKYKRREKRHKVKWSHWDTNSYKELHKTQCTTNNNFLLWLLFLEMDKCQAIHHNNLSLALCQNVDIETELQTQKPINHQKHRQRYQAKAPSFPNCPWWCCVHLFRATLIISSYHFAVFQHQRAAAANLVRREPLARALRPADVWQTTRTARTNPLDADH